MLRCQWCGEKFELKSNWNKLLSSQTFGLAGKEKYCSKKCEVAAQAAQNSSNQSTQGSGIQNQQQNFNPSIAPQDDWGTTVDTISYRLNNLNTKAQTEAKDKEKKAKIVEEMDFGIMRLRSIGANTEADFFEKKLEAVKAIKKKWNDYLN